MIISDSVCIINTQGIRHISHRDYKSYKGVETFYLTVSYEGDTTDFSYKSKFERDTMYDKLRAIMTTKEKL